MLEKKDKEAIERYYARRESRWGYKYILSGNKHYGYYPEGVRLSLKKAVKLMSNEVGKELGLPRAAKILDAGCGEGPVSLYLAEKFGYEVTGIDLLETHINIANENKDNIGLNNVTFKVGDFSDIDYPDNYFDGVCIIEALVHSPDYRITLAEVYRVLKPGGVFVSHNYVMPDKMSPKEEHIFEVVYDGSGMNTLKDFRLGRMGKIWQAAGFEDIGYYNGIKEITPMMRRLWQLAYLPHHIFQLFGKEEGFTNTYAGYWMYKLRHLIRYEMMRSYKPND